MSKMKRENFLNDLLDPNSGWIMGRFDYCKNKQFLSNRLALNHNKNQISLFCWKTKTGNDHPVSRNALEHLVKVQDLNLGGFKKAYIWLLNGTVDNQFLPVHQQEFLNFLTIKEAYALLKDLPVNAGSDPKEGYGPFQYVDSEWNYKAPRRVMLDEITGEPM
jgi:hypothetical protein